VTLSLISLNTILDDFVELVQELKHIFSYDDLALAV
jgi:hypothetical protein